MQLKYLQKRSLKVCCEILQLTNKAQPKSMLWNFTIN